MVLVDINSLFIGDIVMMPERDQSQMPVARAPRRTARANASYGIQLQGRLVDSYDLVVINNIEDMSIELLGCLILGNQNDGRKIDKGLFYSYLLPDNELPQPPIANSFYIQTPLGYYSFTTKDHATMLLIIEDAQYQWHGPINK